MADLLQIIVALDVMALAAAIAMSFQAWRAHRVMRSGQSLTFATAFALVSIGLFARFFTDALVHVGPAYIRRVEGLGQLIAGQELFFLVSALCILSAYTMLLLVVERIRNLSMWILTFLLIIFTIFLARDLYVLTHIVALVLLGLLAHHFWLNYLSKSNTNALIVYLAFFSLMVSHVFALTVSIDRWLHVFYLGFRLIGFFLLFAVSWRSARR